MGINANVSGQPQITASVGETQIDVTVGGGIGPTGPAGTTSWTGIVDKPSSFSPSLHAVSHAVGGVDYIAPAAIGAATVAAAASLQLQVDGKAASSHTHPASAITSGTLNSSRLPLSTVSQAGAVVTGTGLSVSSGILSVSWGSSSTSSCRGDDARLSDSREWSADTVSQADAEAGTSTSRFAFTPLRVFQAIAAWWNASAAKTKLDGIASGATANATDAQLRDRSTHTGTQLASTISDFTTAVIAAAPPTTDASLLTSGTLPDARLSGNIARTSDVTGAVAAVVNAAPASLDTLKELADALGNDASFASTVTNSLAAKAPLVHTHTVSAITDAGTAAARNAPATGDASSSEVVLGSDTRLTDQRVPTDGSVTAAKIAAGQSVVFNAVVSKAYNMAPGGTGITIQGGSSPIRILGTLGGSLFVVNSSGVVTTGQWQGTAVAVAYGGTGATTQAGARTNLGLGSLATQSTVAWSTDITGIPSTFAPSAHKTSHATGGSDALTASDIGAAAASHNHAWSDITSGVPSTFTPSAHNHAASEITSGTLDIARIPTGTSSTTVCIGDDSRLTDARTPTSHAVGSSNTTCTIPASAIVTADLADSAVTTAKIADSAVTLAKTTGIQKTITSGTAAPTGGSDGDIYLQYT